MRRVNDVVPPDASPEQLRAAYGDETADQIVAFLRFLELPQVERDGKQVKVVPDDSQRRVWLLYMHGRISGPRLLRALEWR
jgi:hypothetical protein